MGYLRETENWWLCPHCKQESYEFIDEEGNQWCYRCYYRWLDKQVRRQDWKLRLAKRRDKERKKRKEARQFYELLSSSGILKEYQIGFVLLDYLVV